MITRSHKPDSKPKIKIESLETSKFENTIFEAVYGNDLKRLKDVINSCTSEYDRQRRVNVRDKHLRTPIFYAMYYNNYEMINFLLNNGADTLYSDEKGRTVIHYACIVGVSKGIL